MSKGRDVEVAAPGASEGCDRDTGPATDPQENTMTPAMPTTAQDTTQKIQLAIRATPSRSGTPWSTGP